MATARLRLSLAILALLAPAAAECQSDAALWRFVHPNAKALISLNWQRVRQSPAVAMFREKMLNSALKPSIPGLELLDDVDRILISSPGSKTPKAADADADSEPQAAPAGNAPMLIAIHGNFPAGKVHQVFAQWGAKAQAYNSFQVYRPQSKGTDMAFVIYDAETILFGDAPSIFAAIDRNHFAPRDPEPGSILARAAQLEAAYDFWLIMNSPDVLSDERVAGLLRGGEWLPDAKGFEAGINLRSGLAADLTVRLGSEAEAKHVVAEMARVLAAAMKDKSADAQVREMSKKLKFIADGPAAKISLRLSPQELEKTAQAYAASHKTPVVQASDFAPTVRVTAAEQTPVPAPPAVPGVIRIEGLDDGPREISIGSAH